MENVKLWQKLPKMFQANLALNNIYKKNTYNALRNAIGSKNMWP